MKTLLVIEDDPALAHGICLALQSEAVRCQSCATLAQARALLPACDLAVLDVNLPDGSGLALLGEIRGASALPVILLTANDLETDIVAGLESGADDYITKPFSLAVLRARVRTQLRRLEARTAAPAENCFAQGEFRFDFARMRFLCRGEAVELSKTEQKLLRLLTLNAGQTLPRAVLQQRLWPDGAQYVDENALSVTVKRLRDKLEADPAHPRYIQTVYGIGYGWAVKA